MALPLSTPGKCCDHALTWHTGSVDGVCRACDCTGFVPVSADISAQVLAEKGTRHGQVGGDHYRKHKIQPWDVWDEYDLDRYLANCVKYLLRAGDKGPKIEDLKKARHYLDKAIEREGQNGT